MSLRDEIEQEPLEVERKKRVGLTIAVATGAITVGVLATIGIAVAVRGIVKPPPEPVTITEPQQQPAELPDFCATGYEPIRGGGCLAAPSGSLEQIPVVVYAHGMYGPNNVNEEIDRQVRLAKMANARGFAVLTFRGVQGECKNAQIPDYWCWPSNARNESDGPAFIERWRPALDETQKRLGSGGPRYLLGFSNGAYFAALVATRALVPFDAIAIAHGGPVEPTRANGPKPPILLVSADDDPSDPEVGLLDAELTRENWPHAVVAREGGHALLDWDIDMALTFFKRVRTEQLPLTPALARGRRPTPPSDQTSTTNITSADMSTAPAQTSPAPANASTAPTATQVYTAPPQPTPEAPAPQAPVTPAPPPQTATAPAPPPSYPTPTTPTSTGPSQPPPVPAGSSTSPPAGVPTDSVPSEPYYP